MAEKLIVGMNDDIVRMICEAIGKDHHKGEAIGRNMEKEIEDSEITDENRRNGDLVLNIDFKVNGVELSFSNLMRAYEELYRARLQEEAKELIKSNLSNIHWKLDKIEKTLDMIDLDLIEEHEKKWKTDKEDN